MITLHDFMQSGNCYKVRLLLAQLNVPHRSVEVDLSGPGHQLGQLHPYAKVPLVVLEDGRTLAESNAILLYFAENTELLPSERWERAQALQWLFFEQNRHEPYVARLRFWRRRGLVPPFGASQETLWREQAERALSIMETHLQSTPFFAGSRYSIADIALYAYTHVAPDGGLELAAYPALRDWLMRVVEQPGHVPMLR
jgi:glutathione S-transferase